MIVLGINGGVRMGYQDIAAALVIDGRIAAAVEEERINRIKHSPGMIPLQSVKAVLDIAGISMRDVDLIVSHGSTWGDVYQATLESFFRMYFGHAPKIERIHHHIAHAASTYYASGMEEAMVLTMDASGDGICLQRAVGKQGELEVIEQVPRTNSLGIFYSMMTQYCGFTRDTDEYKLMGLAPYGDPSIHSLDEILEVHDKGYTFNNDFIQKLEPGAPQPTRQQQMFTERLTALLGPSRQPGGELTRHYMDVAAAAQKKLEAAIIKVVEDFHRETGLRRLCIAGGVALNCAANKHLMNLEFLDEFYVQPASGDNGISLGAALWGAQQLGDNIQPMKDAYLGPEFSMDEIRSQLDLTGVSYVRLDDPAEKAAELVLQDKVTAWFQGRMEYGPRALGCRSILANPAHPDMKSIINRKIKFREGFRPFCPSVLAEDHKHYFDGRADSAPYMTINFDVRDHVDLPSITHVDGTARVQTVSEPDNPLFYRYLSALKRQSGAGVSINTSLTGTRSRSCIPRSMRSRHSTVRAWTPSSSVIFSWKSRPDRFRRLKAPGGIGGPPGSAAAFPSMPG